MKKSDQIARLEVKVDKILAAVARATQLERLQSELAEITVTKDERLVARLRNTIDNLKAGLAAAEEREKKLKALLQSPADRLTIALTDNGGDRYWTAYTPNGVEFGEIDEVAWGCIAYLNHGSREDFGPVGDAYEWMNEKWRAKNEHAQTE